MQGHILLGAALPFEQAQDIPSLATRLVQRPDVIVWLLPPAEPNAIGILASPDLPLENGLTARTDLNSLHTVAQLCQAHGMPFLVRDRYGHARLPRYVHTVGEHLHALGWGDIPWLVAFGCGLDAELHLRFGQILGEAIKRTGHQALVLAHGQVSDQQREYAHSKLGRVVKEADLDDYPLITLLGLAKAFPHQVEAWENGALFVPQARPQAEPDGPIVGADSLPDLAKRGIETFLITNKMPAPDAAALERFGDRQGVFVNLFLDGIWRGGLGIPHPVESLAQAAIRHAVMAATQDHRFPAVTHDDLDRLTVQVQLLSEPTMVRDMALLDPETAGLFVTTGYRYGLVLPKLAGIQTPNEQVAAAMQKAGITPGEPMWLYQFKVQEMGLPATVPGNS